MDQNSPSHFLPSMDIMFSFTLPQLNKYSEVLETGSEMLKRFKQSDCENTVKIVKLSETKQILFDKRVNSHSLFSTFW